MRKYLTKYLIAVIDVKSFRIVGKVSGGVIAGFNGMTFPSDGLLSDYQANAGITLTGECLITLTKAHILNDNFTAACVTYENTTNFTVVFCTAKSGSTYKKAISNYSGTINI